MSRPVSKIYKSCQALWLRGSKSAETLTFSNQKEACRAKFVMYSAVKLVKKTGEPNDLAEAVENTEIISGRGDEANTWTIRPKTDNPLLNELISQIEGKGTKVQEPIADSAEDAAKESLRRLMENMKKVEQSPGDKTVFGPPNPYYTREDL